MGPDILMYGKIYESIQAEKLFRRDDYVSGTKNLSINKTSKGNFMARIFKKPIVSH